MKEMECKELSGLECGHVVKGESKQEMLKKVMDHGQEVHGKTMAKMTPPEKETFQNNVENKISKLFM